MAHTIVPVKTYASVFGGLLVLTATTVAVSRVDLGPFNVVLALGIAAVKGCLVAWFFMHIKQSSSLTRLFAVAGLFWMAILFALTFADYVSRGWTPAPVWWK